MSVGRAGLPLSRPRKDSDEKAMTCVRRTPFDCFDSARLPWKTLKETKLHKTKTRSTAKMTKHCLLVSLNIRSVHLAHGNLVPIYLELPAIHQGDITERRAKTAEAKTVWLQTCNDESADPNVMK